MPKISAIIPVYNVEKYLDKCIESVINQTLKDIEIILIDDESPDNCPQMCDQYAKNDNRIKVVHKKNEGLGLTRNHGIRIATGEYIAFIDSDDFIDTCTFEHFYKLAKDNNLDAIYYKFDRNTDEGVKLGTPIDDIIIYEKDKKRNYILDLIASEPHAASDRLIGCSVWNALYKSSIIKSKQIEFHSEREIISEDLIFNLDFLVHTTRIAQNEGRHYHYRINTSSLCRTIREDRVIKNFYLYEYIAKNTERWNLDNKVVEKRNARMFIGYNRTAIQQYMSSPLPYSKKKVWLKEQLSIPLWQTIYETFNWKELPNYKKIFFYLCAKKQIFALYLISVLRKMILELRTK